MAEENFLFPPSFGLGPGSDSILLSYRQGAYLDNGCWETLYLPEQHRQSTIGGSSLDTADMMSLADTSPVLPQQMKALAKHLPVTKAAIPPSTPPPPPKRRRGRPRKNDMAPRPKKEVKTSLPTPSLSQTSSQEVPADTSRPEDNIDNENPLHLSPPGDARLPGAKIDRRRHRNREAAQKCRTRKQYSTQKLVADVTAAEAINESLRRESNGLREETLLLKNMVLQHGDCDCAQIQLYIQIAASRLAQAAPVRSPNPRTVYEHKQQQQQQQQQQHAAAFSADADEDFFFVEWAGAGGASCLRQVGGRVEQDHLGFILTGVSVPFGIEDGLSEELS